MVCWPTQGEVVEDERTPEEKRRDHVIASYTSKDGERVETTMRNTDSLTENR